MYANTTSIFVFGHGVGYTVEKAVEAATTHSDENGAQGTFGVLRRDKKERTHTWV